LAGVATAVSAGFNRERVETIFLMDHLIKLLKSQFRLLNLLQATDESI
jgi:hypothetical protein